MVRIFKRHFICMLSAMIVLMMTSCTPKVLSLIPNNAGSRCRQVQNVTLWDEMDMRKSPMAVNAYYNSNPRKSRVVYELSNQPDANGVCIRYERIYTSKANKGYLKVNKYITDSLPEYHHFRYSVNGDIITKKNYSKLLRLGERRVKAISADAQNNIINIKTK